MTQIVMFKSLRAQPFTTTVLREMAINFPKGKCHLVHDSQAPMLKPYRRNGNA